MGRDSRRLRLVVALLLLTSFTFLTLDSRSGHGAFGGARRIVGDIFGPIAHAVHGITAPVGRAFSAAIHSGRDKNKIRDLEKQITILNQNIASDTENQKARDSLRAGTLRMVLAAITNAEVAGKEARELTDDDVIGVLTSEAKKRRESAEAFDAGNRPELSDKERAEAAVLAEYLPTPLTAEEVSAIVAAAIEKTGAEGPKGIGPVMGVVQPQVRGRADGAAVAAEVRRQLGT